MPKENDPNYERWKVKIDKELEKIEGSVILMGHSIGSFLLLRYLSEKKIDKDIAGMFFIATPFLWMRILLRYYLLMFPCFFTTARMMR